MCRTFLLIASKHLLLFPRMSLCSEQIGLCCKAVPSDSPGGDVPEHSPGEISMHVLPLASRCLYFIHPLGQVPPEWESLGAKRMAGRLFHPFCHFPPASTFTLTPSPSFLIRGIKVIETTVPFEFKHIPYVTKSICHGTGKGKQSLQSPRQCSLNSTIL